MRSVAGGLGGRAAAWGGGAGAASELPPRAAEAEVVSEYPAWDPMASAVDLAGRSVHLSASDTDSAAAPRTMAWVDTAWDSAGAGESVAMDALTVIPAPAMSR